MHSNALGVALLVVAGGIVAVGYFLMRLPDVYVISVASSALIVIDLLTRLKQRGRREWLIVPETGGNFLMVPVWFLGAVIIGLNLLLPR